MYMYLPPSPSLSLSLSLYIYIYTYIILDILYACMFRTDALSLSLPLSLSLSLSLSRRAPRSPSNGHLRASEVLGPRVAGRGGPGRAGGRKSKVPLSKVQGPAVQGSRFRCPRSKVRGSAVQGPRFVVPAWESEVLGPSVRASQKERRSMSQQGGNVAMWQCGRVEVALLTSLAACTTRGPRS